MNFKIKHSIRGRVRLHLDMGRMSFQEADELEYHFSRVDFITKVKIYPHNCDIAICYEGPRGPVLQMVQDFDLAKVQTPKYVTEGSGREVSAAYKGKLILKILLKASSIPFAGSLFYNIITLLQSVRYLTKGAKSLLRRRLDVAVLDATAIAVSLLRGDFATAGSIIFLLGIGDIIEKWTKRKSEADLAKSMALNIETVWVKRDGFEVEVALDDVKQGELVVVEMGGAIPFDGTVTSGEAMVNQSSLTGESLPVYKKEGHYVYAGTVLDEGSLVVKVEETSKNSRYEQIIVMIQQTQRLKSNAVGTAETLADKLVPWTFLTTGLTYLISGNPLKALSVLMVDFSCAMKLAMPITVLSAIRQAGGKRITVKGGKYLEDMAEADIIVFDKTGTLTKAEPKVADVVAFNGNDSDEMLRIAACLEEHFPHSIAKAVVEKAREKKLSHDEMHSKVEYVLAHGIATHIEGDRVVLGSNHFIFEDEKAVVPEGEAEKFASLPKEHSHLHLSINGILSAVLLIDDPLREEAKDVVGRLRACGFEKVIMMTGDSQRTASVIAEETGVDEFHSEVLPEEKASLIQDLQRMGHKVVMVGDGINDSPALSIADVGIAISDGAAIARQTADITIESQDLEEIITLRKISEGMLRRIHSNYHSILFINGSIIAGGVLGLLSPTQAALLHNTSTIYLSLNSMTDLK